MEKACWIFVACAILLSCETPPAGYQSITVKGSDTEVNVALSLAETFMATDPAVSIAVTGGGSGAGIAALINNKTDIANASRPIKPEEIELAKQRQIVPLPIIFAIDALAIAVHESLPLDSLTVQQLGAIFSGKITNWRAVGGPDLVISLYGRQSNSGTFVYFRDSVLQSDYATSLKQMNGTAQIVEAMKQDRAGVGYVGAGYVLKEKNNGIKVLKIKRNAGAPAISPLETANILNGTYALVRPLFQYTNGAPSGKLREFLEFGLGAEGQRIVAENGYFPISAAQVLLNKKILLEHEKSEVIH